MSNRTHLALASLSLLLALFLTGIQTVLAYSCEAEFSKAEQTINEAKAAVNEQTDARIKASLAEAEGLLKAAQISHRQASERHVGEHGKYMHGDAVRKARWAQTLATEVIFLATGDPR